MANRQRNATAKNKYGSLGLSEYGQKYLGNLLYITGQHEQKIELMRQCLAINENFEPYSAFQRLDRNQCGFLGSRELLNFIRDNGVSEGVTEADCYYVIKFFDSDLDGKLHFADFLQLILPCSNSKLRATATQRPKWICNKFDYLTIDVEKELAELLLGEVRMHRETEEAKQLLVSCKGFSYEQAYVAVDDCNLKYVYQKNLERFFNSQKRKTTEFDHFAVIRRMDLDADQKICQQEFIDGIKPQEPFSKMLVRSRELEKKKADDSKKQFKSATKFIHKSAEKQKRGRTKRAEPRVDVFRQPAISTDALDADYKRVGSVSPLKVRPVINMQNLQEEEHYSRHNSMKRGESGVPNRTGASLGRSGSPQRRSLPRKLVSDYESDKSMDYNQRSQRSILKQHSPSRIKTPNKVSFAEQAKSQGRHQGFTAEYSWPQDFNTTNSGINRTFQTVSGAHTRQGSPIKNTLTPVKHQQSPSNTDLTYPRSSLKNSPEMLPSMLAASGTKSMRAAESEDHMFFVLVKQLDLEKVLERAKVELSLMTDFNLIDAFRMFDPDGTGAASHSAIRQVLNELNCRHKEEELLLFMERFDRDKDGAVRYSEFCDAFLPIDSFHASLLAKKAPLSSAQNRPRSQIFHPETKRAFVAAWKGLFKMEVEQDRLRVGVQRRHNFDVHEAFTALDIMNDQYICKEDLRQFFSNNGQYVPEKDLCGLIERYDRNRDGKISYTEFAAELTPRCLM